jgi:hypothetical protein
MKAFEEWDMKFFSEPSGIEYGSVGRLTKRNRKAGWRAALEKILNIIENTKVYSVEGKMLTATEHGNDLQHIVNWIEEELEDAPQSDSPK